MNNTDDACAEPQTVVALTWVLSDAPNEELDVLEQPLEFLLGSGDLLPSIENALYGHSAGASVQLYLEPENGFGDYDANLVLLEPRAAFGAELEEGMVFEELPAACSSQARPGVLYAVTDIYPEHVVLDGNHPLAGMALRVQMRIHGVRKPNAQELECGSAGTAFFKVLPQHARDQSIATDRPHLH